MNSTEPKNAFLLMRANGWSLRSISTQLGIPKSTLFDWETEPPTRRMINVLKSLQIEKLQERYIPSFEEELQKLSTCLDRVERALEKQNFEAMRPEFLLRTSLQLRSRLNTLRSDIQPAQTLNQGERPPLPLPGCISRSQTLSETDDDSNPPHTVAERRSEEANPDKTEILSVSDPSTSATCDSESRTPVRTEDSPSSHEPPAEKLQPIFFPNPERNGDLATSLPNIPAPAPAHEIAFTAAFHPDRNAERGLQAASLSGRHDASD